MPSDVKPPLIPYGRREFLKKVSRGSLGLAAASALASVPGCRRGPAGGKRPDVVLILADDMGYSDVGCFGGEIHTPHIDRLAENGIRFTQFYNTSRCCPTRASLLTGLYPHQAGVGWMMRDQGLDGYRGDLNTKNVTIAEVLSRAGYTTFMSGKWHVTRFGPPDGPRHNWPLQRGFDRFFGTIGGSGSYFRPPSLILDNDAAPPVPDNFYYTDAISERAARFIQEHTRDRGAPPFFLYVAYTAPHWPLHALQEDIAKYQGRYDAGWDVLRERRHARMIELGVVDGRWTRTPRDPRVGPWQEEEHKGWQARRMEVYAAMVDRMDRGIGRIVTALEEAGRLENTLILFLSDNGGCAEEFEFSHPWFLDFAPKTTRDGRPVRAGNLPSILPGPEDTFTSYGVPWANVSNTPFRLYKSWVHEGGIATPLIIHWPARIKERGGFDRRPGHLIDIMPTLVEAAGGEYPNRRDGSKILPMEGVSLSPGRENRSPVGERSLFFEHEGNRAVRLGKWKLVAAGREGPWELYDLEADRTETSDLAGRHPDIVSDLAERWGAWAERTGVLPRPDET